tara:strand:- start:20845 stop:21195 length:351 start_codon:yes stop_codon:yes gene_type:complete
MVEMPRVARGISNVSLHQNLMVDEPNFGWFYETSVRYGDMTERTLNVMFPVVEKSSQSWELWIAIFELPHEFLQDTRMIGKTVGHIDNRKSKASQRALKKCSIHNESPFQKQILIS